MLRKGSSVNQFTGYNVIYNVNYNAIYNVNQFTGFYMMRTFALENYLKNCIKLLGKNFGIFIVVL